MIENISIIPSLYALGRKPEVVKGIVASMHRLRVSSDVEGGRGYRGGGAGAWSWRLEADGAVCVELEERWLTWWRGLRLVSDGLSLILGRM